MKTRLFMPRAPVAKGFTLVELLIVIGIIALLAAIIFPATSKVRDNASISKTVPNLRQLQIANLTYASDHNANFVSAFDGGTCANGWKGNTDFLSYVTTGEGKWRWWYDGKS